MPPGTTTSLTPASSGSYNPSFMANEPASTTTPDTPDSVYRAGVDEDEDRDPLMAGSRMTFGDHLEELRRRVIIALTGLGAAIVLCLIFGRTIVVLLCRPLWAVQLANGLSPQVQVLSPAAGFSVYLRMGALAGLTLAAPWVLYQLWLFVAAGLYPRERRFARGLVPASLGLFGAGVLFLYFIVLPLVLQFFITFNRSLEIGTISVTPFERFLLGMPDVDPSIENSTERGTEAAPLRLPVLRRDPDRTEPGDAWINTTSKRLIVEGPEGRMSAALEPGDSPTMLQSQFALDFYVTFVLSMALGFGLAFETPIVVCGLAWTGLAPVSTMRRARGYVLLAVAFVSAVLTPPDLLSMMLMLGPMYGLFEIGLLAARLRATPDEATVRSSG